MNLRWWSNTLGIAYFASLYFPHEHAHSITGAHLQVEGHILIRVTAPYSLGPLLGVSCINYCIYSESRMDAKPGRPSASGKRR